MNTNQILFLVGAALCAAGEVFTNAGETASTAAAPAPAPGGDTAEGEAPKRRGRPPGSANKPDAAPAEDDGEARFQKNRALIKPLVDASQGEDVKKVIAKYSKTGLKDIPADKQAEFEKDIDGLAY